MKYDENSLYNIKSSVEGRRCCLFDLATWKNGLAFKKINFAETGVPVIKIAELNNGIGGTTAYTEQKFSEDVHLKKGDLLFSWSGNPQTSIDIFRFNLEEGWLNQHIFKVTPDENVVDGNYFYFLMKNLKSHFTQIATNKQTTGLGHVTIADIKRMSVIIPSIDVQRKIVSYIKPIDDKIVLNNEINNNLLEQVLALYTRKFVTTNNPARSTIRADEYFDIAIGKTPPRKEPHWFSNNPDDVTWISISDMGSCGVYINSSSEQLTQEAVEKHNVKIVPNNTVILSFKLTVGRIAITDGEMATNEAIAHFKTDKPEINEYLYCYLKKFNYQTMGSTSSIATAVNSKIIKAMPFIVPTDEEIREFHDIAAPMFSLIKSNQQEINRLSVLRDSLLPKLMSGELDVSDIDI
ncbi:restriction endonuclease subunit S [Dialister invisus]|uniref:restriction endonuclease subunit S n=1 Tax=Dialister TaxID=39948 RepID=UPI003995428B